MQITEHNVETGEITVREATKKELEQFEADKKAEQLKIQKIEADKLARAALLNKLGITEDEAKLLLG